MLSLSSTFAICRSNENLLFSGTIFVPQWTQSKHLTLFDTFFVMTMKYIED
jgi:hypothetical protein